MENIVLANFIFMFHTLIILFILFAPFIDIPAILILHITFSICLLVHWWANNNICSLSLLESKLRGMDHTESFTHKFIAPIYDISQTEWSRICIIITIILLCISSYKLYYSKKTFKIMFLSIFDSGPHTAPPLGWAGGAGNLAVFRPQKGFMGEKCEYLQTGESLRNFCRQPFLTKIGP